MTSGAGRSTGWPPGGIELEIDLRPPQPARIIQKEVYGTDTARFILRPQDIKPFEGTVPGQYIMLWVPAGNNLPDNPGVSDMLPFSIAGLEDEHITLLVRAVGETTRELLSYGEGDKVGISAPRGNGFTSPHGGPALLVAGGTGIAPVLFLRDLFSDRGIESNTLFGVKSKNGLLGLESESGFTFITEDGSHGHIGIVTDLLADIWGEGLGGKPFSSLFCCGPEPMMKRVLDFSVENGIDAQFSLERYFYCASGLCGFCELGGLRVCVEGPVFTSAQLRGITDFGKRRRDASGVFKAFR